MKFGIGQPVRRREDPRFITGKGRYTADLSFDGEARACFLRSPHAHARIARIDASAAKAAPGVVAVYTHDDLAAEGIKPLPCAAAEALGSEDAPLFVPDRHLLAKTHVRHVGEPVAMIVADSVDQARDASELIEVEYETLPPAPATETALNPETPVIHQNRPDNLALDWHTGEKEPVEKALAAARHVTRLKLVNNRVVVGALEPRAAVGLHDSAAGYTLHVCSQGVHALRTLTAATLDIPPEQLRVITGDVGGGFGMKAFIFHEYPLVLFAARRTGRPVKWVSDRSEAFISDTQGRDHITEAAIAFDHNAKIQAVKVETIANVGAYHSQFAPFIPTLAAAGMHAGLYHTPLLYNQVRIVFTNTLPIDAYRGAGRPEASYVIERLMDAAARELGLAPDELRRRNFASPTTPPDRRGASLPIDSGDFARVMEDALKRADAANFPARREAARKKGFRRGLGISCYIERTGGASNQFVRLAVDPEARLVHLHPGTQSTGQGHETAWAQILSDEMGLPLDNIRVHSGDTAALSGGGGTGGSSSLYMAAAAISDGAGQIAAQGKSAAAALLGAPEGQIEFRPGTETNLPSFHAARTNRSIGLFDLAAKTGKLDAEGGSKHEMSTFPNGCHVCEIEIEDATGRPSIVRYTATDDFGKIVNPLLAAGQVHGGIVQGAGQALMEEAVYDENGQLLTGSFMDYAMPRADDMPPFDVRFFEDAPSQANALGVKGCGEAGTVGALAAVVNAALDALTGCKIAQLDMPLTAQKLWRAMHE